MFQIDTLLFQHGSNRHTESSLENAECLSTPEMIRLLASIVNCEALRPYVHSLVASRLTFPNFVLKLIFGNKNIVETDDMMSVSYARSGKNVFFVRDEDNHVWRLHIDNNVGCSLRGAETTDVPGELQWRQMCIPFIFKGKTKGNMRTLYRYTHVGGRKINAVQKESTAEAVYGAPFQCMCWRCMEKGVERAVDEKHSQLRHLVMNHGNNPDDERNRALCQLLATLDEKYRHQYAKLIPESDTTRMVYHHKIAATHVPYEEEERVRDSQLRQLELARAALGQLLGTAAADTPQNTQQQKQQKMSLMGHLFPLWNMIQCLATEDEMTTVQALLIQASKDGTRGLQIHPGRAVCTHCKTPSPHFTIPNVTEKNFENAKGLWNMHLPSRKWMESARAFKGEQENNLTELKGELTAPYLNGTFPEDIQRQLECIGAQLLFKTSRNVEECNLLEMCQALHIAPEKRLMVNNCINVWRNLEEKWHYVIVPDDTSSNNKRKRGYRGDDNKRVMITHTLPTDRMFRVRLVIGPGYIGTCNDASRKYVSQEMPPTPEQTKQTFPPLPGQENINTLRTQLFRQLSLSPDAQIDMQIKKIVQWWIDLERPKKAEKRPRRV